MENMYFSLDEVKKFRQREKDTLEMAEKVEAMEDMEILIKRLLGSKYPESIDDSYEIRCAARRILDAFGAQKS